MDDLSRQIEEIEALNSIYGNEWKTDNAATRSYSINIKEHDYEVLLCVTLPDSYPSKSPPTFEFSAPWMDRKVKEDVKCLLLDVYSENPGEAVIFQWIEKVREELQKMKSNADETSNSSHNVFENHELLEQIARIQEQNEECPEIIHGETIVDRKSAFQGHAAIVQSVDDVRAVLNKLKTNKKIMNATHNMYAYRIERKSASGTAIVQDCDDDGENHAGGRMLHLMQILDQKNALVVVSRWYGGIQLGPDRFRHINNATRQVLVQAGLVKT